MRVPRLFLEVLVILFAAGVLILVQYTESRRNLNTLEKAGMTRLIRSYEPLLKKSFDTKDDLAMQEYLSLLNKAPGVLQGRLVSGRLEIHVSPHLKKKLLRKQLRSSVLSLLLAGSILTAYFFWIHRFQARVHHTLLELQSKLDLEKRNRTLSEGNAEKSLQQKDSLLQLAMDYIEKPVILLDAHQRITALSRAALKPLNIQSFAELLNKSWHEVPLLASSGQTIEESLASPGKTFQVFSNKRELLLELRASHGGPQSVCVQG